MKKTGKISLILAGFVLGVAVTSSPTIHAATFKLLGSKVSAVLNVKINNKSIGDGAVINGTTYVPLRSAANQMGLEVTKVDSTEVTLTGQNITDNSDQIRTKINEIDGKIGDLNVKIRNANDVISNKDAINRQISRDEDNLKLMDNMKANNSPMYDDNTYKATQQRIDNSKKTLSDAETNLPIWQQQLADLQKQKADLEAQL